MKKANIEDACNYFLEDNNLKNGITRLLEKCCELKMKSTLISTNTFKCAYKGKKVIHYSIGNRISFQKDHITIGVEIADKEDLERVIIAQPEDLITEFLNRKTTHCGSCNTHCENGVKIEIYEKKHHFCSRYNYMCNNPTPEQFKMIERFIDIRIEYINSKKSNK